MIEYPLEKYKFYFGPNKVVAVSTYEGKTVRGVAKTDPRDTFDVDAGKKLAAARCNAKIAAKRKNRADRELKKAVDAFSQAQRHMEKMNDYYEDARIAVKKANTEVTNLLAKM